MNIWQKKLYAFLHDTPSKVLDIKTHQERSKEALRVAGFPDDQINEQLGKIADHTAAAADRFPFPYYATSGLQCHFDGVRNQFHHPLDGESRLQFHNALPDYSGIECEKSVQPILNHFPQDWDEEKKWRARFFAHWRLWEKYAIEKDYRFGFLPADSRLPDHTIWNHNQVVSALFSCVEESSSTANENDTIKAAFLKFQIGPVQEFIAQARSIRDLWSGSYLLSWLMAVGLKKLSEEAGPDSLIYPMLRNQPLFDLQWKKELWDQVKIGNAPVWKAIVSLDKNSKSSKPQDKESDNSPSDEETEDASPDEESESIQSDKQSCNMPRDKYLDFLTPSLPNVFLAVVPVKDAKELARKVEEAIRNEFKQIAESVWKACEDAKLTENPKDGAFRNINRKERFDRQVERFLSISYQITPWQQSIDEIKSICENLPLTKDDNEETVLERVEKIIEKIIQAAQALIPVEHRDRRFYKDPDKTQLNNIGVAWALMCALNSWQLDAVRQTRHFRAWNKGGWTISTANNKDSLTGKEEAVGGGREWLEFCKELAARGEYKDKKPDPESEDTVKNMKIKRLANRFKHDDWLGAITLIKRLWDITYLEQKFRDVFDDQKFSITKTLRMPNTYGLAKHRPLVDPEEEDKSENKQQLEAEEGKVNTSQDSDRNREDETEEDIYYAVLAFDGDEIGKWLAGDKCPKFREQLADYTDGSGNRLGALEYFERDSDPDGQGTLKERFKDLLETRRPISPSYHLQFSEALANFAIRFARPIVEVFDGRLIYAGGDDVLALLPADTAIDCARALQMAFRGDKELPQFLKEKAEKLYARNKQIEEKERKKNKNKKPYFNYYQSIAARYELIGCKSKGFLTMYKYFDQDNHEKIPFIVPGPKATASVGIAISHIKSPLQDAVRAARKAEKDAKQVYKRNAVAVTLLKRSGETIQWGCNWDSNGLEAFDAILTALIEKYISAKFPYRLVELVEPYLSDAADPDTSRKWLGGITPADEFTPEKAKEILLKELDVVLERQHGSKFDSKNDKCKNQLDLIKNKIEGYLEGIKESANKSKDEKHNIPDKRIANKMVKDLIGLCNTVAFISRNLEDIQEEKEQTGQEALSTQPTK